MPTKSSIKNNNKANPGIDNLVASGSDSSAVTQDWYVHIQTVDLMYLRNNQYDSATSSTVATPNALSNYLDVHYTVQTTDEVWENATFSGELWEPQTLELVTSYGTSGGFGVCGVVNTSSVGYIRRAVRKNAAGVILDPTGVCTQSGNLILDNMPGAYDYTFDTSAQVNSNLQHVMGRVHGACPNFIATLVDL
jgi:hypothetical protein